MEDRARQGLKGTNTYVSALECTIIYIWFHASQCFPKALEDFIDMKDGLIFRSFQGKKRIFKILLNSLRIRTRDLWITSMKP